MTTRRATFLWTMAAVSLLAQGPAAAELVPDVPAVQPARPAPGGMYVPHPKTESLDSAPAAGKGGKLDQVLTLQGDRLNGSILDIQADGRLRLSGPQYGGEVLVQVSALDRVTLQGASKDTGKDEIVLTNKDSDRIAGKVLAITADDVTIDSPVAGTLKISRKVIRAVSFGEAKSLLVESRFESGDMDPWKTGMGSWAMGENVLTCTGGSGNPNTIWAELDQKEAVTMEAKVESLQGNNLYCSLILFADNTQNYYGQNSVFVMFQNSECYIGYARSGGTNNVSNRYYGGNAIRDGVLRMAYDPKTSKVRVWLNASDLGEYTIPNPAPQNGNFVMFQAQYPCKVEYIRVLPGIVPPSGEGGEKGDLETDLVQFSNKDRVSTKTVALADGVFMAETSYGQLKCPVGNVEKVIFRSKGQEAPRARKGDVRVQTSHSRFTFQLEKLSEEHLTGQSEYLGNVQILRGAIQQIRFNLYR